MKGQAATTKHPTHMVMAGPTFRFPAKPLQASGWLGRKMRRACRRRGGHWWHPADAMIGWFCCQCGAETDGMPEDGR